MRLRHVLTWGVAGCSLVENPVRVLARAPEVDQPRTLDGAWFTAEVPGDWATLVDTPQRTALDAGGACWLTLWTEPRSPAFESERWLEQDARAVATVTDVRRRTVDWAGRTWEEVHANGYFGGLVFYVSAGWRLRATAHGAGSALVLLACNGPGAEADVHAGIELFERSFTLRDQ